MPSLFYIVFLKLSVACILYVVYVREDNDSDIGYDYTACMDYLDPAIHCHKKAIKLKHTLMHYYKDKMIMTQSYIYDGNSYTTTHLPRANELPHWDKWCICASVK